MINMMELDYTPYTVEWIHGSGDAVQTLAVSDKNSPAIYTYDGQGDGKPLKVLDRIHKNPVGLIRYNPKFDVIISADRQGMIGKL